MSNQVFTVTPRRARELISDYMQAGLVPYVEGSPGLGKSSIIKAISRDLNLKVIDHRLSTSSPTDMSGLPNFDSEGCAYFAPFSGVFPTEGTPLPRRKVYEDGELVSEVEYEGWNLFLDELPAAPKAVQAAAFKLILDKQVGQYELHQNVVITAAGNLLSDRSAVNPLLTAMQSRLVHLQLVVDQKEWMQDVALPEDYDHRIIAFLSQYPEKLMDFRPDHHDKTFACPRTWEFVNKFLKSYSKRGKVLREESSAAFAGIVGSGVGVEFLKFTEVFSQLVTLADVERSPTTCPVPTEADVKWATICSLMQNCDARNFGSISTYINRFSLDFKMLFYRFLLARKPKIQMLREFGPAIAQISQYLSEA